LSVFALRAGLTELFVTGITTRWINVKANPGQAIFVGGWAIRQLWWVAPIVGAILAGAAHSFLAAEHNEPEPAFTQTVTP
jgi:aquaporin Z